MGRMRRLSYANVTSTIALVCAAAGGTAAAVSGINADKVDGVNAAKIDYVVNDQPPPQKFKTILDQGGLRLRGRCVEQSGTDFVVKAISKVDDAEIQVSLITNDIGPSADLEAAIDRNFDKGDELEVTALHVGGQGVAHLAFSTEAGSHVTATFQIDVGSILGEAGPKRCLAGGTALHVPG